MLYNSLVKTHHLVFITVLVCHLLAVSQIPLKLRVHNEPFTNRVAGKPPNEGVLVADLLVLVAGACDSLVVVLF